MIPVTYTAKIVVTGFAWGALGAFCVLSLWWMLRTLLERK